MQISVGRNEPCPCGSGKKYKRCCLKADASSAPVPHSNSMKASPPIVDPPTPAIQEKVEPKVNSLNVDNLTEEQLIELNHRIVERIRFLRESKTHHSMMNFKIGERVAFQTENRAPLFGIVTRYNKKTVTIITDCGHRWNVAPQLLKKADVAAPKGLQTNIAEIFREKKHSEE